MSQIEQVREPRKLFKWAIDRHIQLDKGESMAFYRTNRWRYNTFNRFNFLKYLHLKGPIAFGISTCIAFDYIFGFYANPVAH